MHFRLERSSFHWQAQKQYVVVSSSLLENRSIKMPAEELLAKEVRIMFLDLSRFFVMFCCIDLTRVEIILLHYVFIHTKI